MEESIPKNGAGKIEILISALGSLVCFSTTYSIWRSLIPIQDIWLLPGVYFLELIAGAVICFLAYFLRYARASTISWIYSGILAIFIFLAGFSVGLLYVPVFLIFAGLSIYTTFKYEQNILQKLGIFVLSGFVQLALMLVFIWFSMQ